MYFIGADHHKRSTYMTSLDASGQVVFKGNLSADRVTLERFLREHPKPFVLGIEACYAWEYVADLAEGFGQEVRVGHPLLLKAFARKHKKNDNAGDNDISQHRSRAAGVWFLATQSVYTQTRKISVFIFHVHEFNRRGNDNPPRYENWRLLVSQQDFVEGGSGGKG